jgi:hypothetical protein
MLTAREWVAKHDAIPVRLSRPLRDGEPLEY